MEATWYFLIALMLTTYVVLDGFDLGAGTAHLWVARTDAERRTVLAAIGPVWDGNEVWLVASGGVLVFAFPRVYAAAFSGFYLPLMMVLWLLVGRGIAIELRSHEQSPLWHAFWDAVFALSSAALAVVLGVALGNVIRGVPLEADGYFRAPLFTDLRTGPRPGALDWYTALVGLYALLTLWMHGALYLQWKTAGQVRSRSVRLAWRLLPAVVALGAAVTAATARVNPDLFRRLASRPVAWLMLLPIVGGLIAIPLCLKRGRERGAFLASSALVGGLLVATAAGMFPVMLRSTVDTAWSIDAYHGGNGPAGLRVGLMWWIPAIAVAVAYFVYLFRSFAGKVGGADGE